MIYFVQSIDGGPVKIGCTDNFGARLKTLEYHYGTPLAVLGTMPGDVTAEREIHERFKHLRFDRTEQFRPAADLMAYIGLPLLVGLNPDTVEAMPVVSGGRPLLVQVRGSKEWGDWVARLARKDNRSIPHLVEVALKHYALTLGFTEPPPER